MSIKAVIFDLDQTLVDSLERFYLVFNALLEKYKANRVEWSDFIKLYSDDELDKLIPKYVNKVDFWKEFLLLYDTVGGRAKARLIDGVEEVLSYLKKRGYKIVVVTGRMSPRELVEQELRELNILQYIDRVYTALGFDDYAKGFNKKDLLRAVLKEMMLSPSECIFVGDYDPDMKAGKELGMLTIGVLTGLRKEDDLRKAGADIVLKSIRELPKVLGKIGR